MRKGLDGLTVLVQQKLKRVAQSAVKNEVGFGTCGREGETDARCGLDDAGSDFQEAQTQRRELGGGQFPGFGNGVAHREHQPIGGGVEHEANLVGERRTAAGAVRGELRLVQLDQVLGLAARAIEAVIDPLGRADVETVTTKRMSSPSSVASIRAMARRSRSQDFAWWRVSA